MKRTTAEANDGNRYTEGNPALGVPATVVGAEELNNIQEEICNVVEDAGITLNGAVETQMLTAIKSILQRGGTQSSQTIDDNAAAEDLTALLFSKTTVKAVRVLYDIFRRNDSKSANETGEMYISHDTEADDWEIQTYSVFGDAEVTFAVDNTGQVSYTSSTYGGTGYSATMRFTEITTIAQ